MSTLSPELRKAIDEAHNAVSDKTDREAELSALRTGTVSISESDFTESMRMAEEIGKVKMAQAMASGLSLSVIRWFAAMKESGSYKKTPIIDFQGKSFRPSTFEELCEGMGFSKSSVNEHLQNFAALGERCLAEAQELGLKVRDMRKVRKALKDASEEAKHEVFAALKNAKDSSEDLKTALDVVCAQLTESKKENKKLVEQAEKMKKAEENLRKDYDARGKVLDAKSAQYDELNEKYIRATSPHPSDVELTKQEKNLNARKMLDERRGAVFLAVTNLASFGSATLADSDIDEETAAYVHQGISETVRELGDILRKAGIDIDLGAEFVVDFGEADDEDATLNI